MRNSRGYKLDALISFMSGCAPSKPRTTLDRERARAERDVERERERFPCTSWASMSSSLSLGSGAFTNHHWISKYTEAVPLWNAHAISMFWPSLTVMLEGRSVNRPADERRSGGRRGWGGGNNDEASLCVVYTHRITRVSCSLMAAAAALLRHTFDERCLLVFN